MINNTIIEANKQGRKATVFALAHPALYMIEMAAHIGFDAISIDGEHGGSRLRPRYSHRHGDKAHTAQRQHARVEK